MSENLERLRSWSAGDWAALDDLLRLDGFRLEHCGHCGRYPDGDPDKHPSCLIVALDEAQRP